jgi:hypothetical protein
MEKKMYSVSDSKNAVSNIVIADCYWLIDNVDKTKTGEFSKAPLFKLQLKQHVAPREDVPEGFVDGSAALVRNRTYFVREGRPLYNELLSLWKDLGEDFAYQFMQDYSRSVFYGHVERVSGVQYSKKSRGGSIITSTKAEFWYPSDYEEGTAMDDFVYMCNKGVYTPTIDDTPKVDPMAEAIAKLPPELLAYIRGNK